MIEHLFINALALGGGLFIGYMRAKEKYETLNRRNLQMEISEKSLEELKAKYEEYKDNPDAVFEFQGEKMLVNYAKYLIEYLEGEFESVKRQENNRTKKDCREHEKPSP